ncbi:MAG TPA: hypothetical protein PK079_03180 [Leptospiraceae bacterium]|nr:hypothetical protein [Leptospiraceae bacterium]HMW03756.1 hypothetical protein [Leptospiraceae bacterium]HMX31869.1 hypothetical protein [Leptospiraceae bacterium]HMY29736.1 hypothetical protein [Leptospiraceae bacterium]HMZ62865.1 hypothetical protein [Leptospiraceae bacterium]
MQKRFHKYFWDGLENWSPEFQLRRIIEYASFPDLIQYPFEEVKENLSKIRLEKLRTGENRKELIIKLSPFVSQASSWEEAIWKMIEYYREQNKERIA